MIQVLDENDPVEHGNTEEGDKANTRGDTQVKPAHPEQDHSAGQGERQIHENEHRVSSLAEHQVQQSEDDGERDRHHDHQVSRGALLVFE